MDLATHGRHLLDYWNILVRRRWVVILVLTAACLIALVGSFLATPQYRATATLHIERQSPDILTFRDLGQTDYSWAAYTDFYQTQYKILSSPAVARMAADRLGLVSHPDFVATDSKPGLLARLRGLIPRRGTSVPPDPLDVASSQVLGSLEVAPVRNSQLVQLSWVSTDPELAARVANAMAAAYIEYNIESQFSTTDQAQEFLVNQVGKLKSEIDTIEDQLQDYGEAKRIISINDSNNITLQALQDTASQRTAAQTTLALAEATFKSANESEADALPAVMNSELIARLRQEHAAYEAELSEKSRRFKDGWPGMQTLKSKLDQAGDRLDVEIERIAQQVRASAEAAYLQARQEVENLQQLLVEQENAAQRLRRDSVEFANLQSEVKKKRETLNQLMRRQTEMVLSSRLKDMDQTSTNIRIVEPARPPLGPFSPSTRNNLALSVFFGLLIGISLAFFLDYLDNTINSAAELARIVSLPLLAVVPRHGDTPATFTRVRRRGPVVASRPVDLVAHLDGRSATAEAYRELRTSILLSNPGRPPRRLMVTSSLPEEGKTATAINLAVVLAQLGRRVLIVDTDLRRPRLHKAFGLENRSGVSTYLSGLEEDPAGLVLPSGVDNLGLLLSGPIPPNPSELLNSSRFNELGEELLAKGYDHIVFDSPPVLSVADPVIIASVMDTGVLVARAGKTPRQSIRLAADRFEQGGFTHMGVVLNDLDSEATGAYHYRYRYYGRYGESPGEDDADENAPARRTGA